jgi:hypothetical protein
VEETRDVHKILVGNPEEKRPLERPRHRWEGGVFEMGLDSSGTG